MVITNFNDQTRWSRSLFFDTTFFVSFLLSSIVCIKHFRKVGWKITQNENFFVRKTALLAITSVAFGSSLFRHWNLSKELDKKYTSQYGLF